jgi:hypothetical protein
MKIFGRIVFPPGGSRFHLTDVKVSQESEEADRDVAFGEGYRRDSAL